MKQLEQHKSFMNSFKRGPDSLTLTYSVFDGFERLIDAQVAVERLGQCRDYFVYIAFQEMVYAVSMETLAKQVVIGQERTVYRHNGAWTTCDTVTCAGLPYLISKPRIGSLWPQAFKLDLEHLQGQPLILHGADIATNTRFCNNSKVLLGQVFFDTQVPVFQLNALDAYFTKDLPSQRGLGEKGIKAINPFTEEKTIGINRPYTYNVYVKECQ